MTPPLLAVSGLSVSVARPGSAPLPILSDIAFDLARGGRLGIVGESGSGKSMLALALIGLLPGGARASGTIHLDGTDLLALPEAALCRIRGRRIGMIFQEPLTALNPAMRIGDQVAEGPRGPPGPVEAEARHRALALLDRVRIPQAARRIDAYPHELSGGQRQRVGIAIALAPGPALLVADEPTTALDVTVQAEILAILDELVRQDGMALILVSHDLGVVARATDRTLVLYAGTRQEDGPTAAVLRDPAHPYTRGLLGAMPRRGARPGRHGGRHGASPPSRGRCRPSRACRPDAASPPAARTTSPNATPPNPPGAGGTAGAACAAFGPTRRGTSCDAAAARRSRPRARLRRAPAPARARRRVARRRGRQHRGRGGGKRLRQVHARAARGGARPADRRPGAAGRRGPPCPARARPRPPPPRRADGVPGPLRLARPALARRPHRRRAPACAGGPAGPGRARRPGGGGAGRGGARGGGRPDASRTRSRAANASASPSRGRW